jgi:hypothetical protein
MLITNIILNYSHQGSLQFKGAQNLSASPII